MAVVTTNLGVVTAYGDAVEGGYTGTKEQWQALMADYGTIGTQAQTDAQTASTAAQTATTKASEASASATQAVNAKTAAETAQSGAESAASSVSASASQIATNTADIADLKEDLTESRTLTSDDFQQGVWVNTSADAPTSSTVRICTKQLYPVFAGDKISITSSSLYVCFGVFSDDTGSVKYLDFHNWAVYSTATEFEFTADGYLFIDVHNSDSSTITANDYDATIILYRTTGYHANHGMMAYTQALRNLDALDVISDGSVKKNLTMQIGKYVNTSGVTVDNGNTTLAVSGFIPIEDWMTSVSFTAKAQLTSLSYSVNFYNSSYTWLSGSNNLTISADDFPTGAKYIVLFNYDTTSAHNTCAVTFYGFTRIDDLEESVTTLESANAIDDTVINKDVFTDKTVTVNTNINYSTGAANANSSFAASTVYTAVEANTTYHVMRNNYKLHGTGNVAFYNSSKTYISGQQSDWTDWTTPSGCAYVRFSVYYGSYTSETFSFDDVVIVKGSSASALNGLSALTASQYSPLYGKKWVGIGDSLTEVNARADLRYWNYIIQLYRMTFSNMGVGGTGYINRQNVSKAFYQRALSIDTDADVITVFGGVNDCLFATADMGSATDTGTTTWCGCVNTLIDNIRSLYLYAPLGIISPLPCDWTDSNNESNYDTQLPSDTTCRMSQFVELLEEICKLRGVPFLDLFHTSGMIPEDSTFCATYYSCGDSRTGDGLHPNSEGHKLFYRKIEKFLETLLAE